MDEPLPARAIREALIRVIPRDLAEYGDRPPDAHTLFVPERHRWALDPDAMVIRGIRGSGKSYWWKVLQDPILRRVVAGRLKAVGLQAVTDAVTAYGADAHPDRYPGRDEWEALLAAGLPPRAVWRAVILWGVSAAPSEAATWGDRALWVRNHPGEYDRVLRTADAERVAGERVALLLFDGIDRASSSWQALVAIHRALLETLLDLRHLRAIRGKAFVRADYLDNPGVTGFPDASKVLRNVVDLAWSREDLYGLLFQFLGNAGARDGVLADGADAFRRFVAGLDLGAQRRLGIEAEPGAPWQVPDALRTQEGPQREVVEALADTWMGSDPRRGRLYSWLVEHLMDGKRLVSPRSFLAAVRGAANFTEARLPEHPLALHWQGVREGVARASEIRVAELVNEEHPWVRAAMEALAGLQIPCDVNDLLERWTEEHTLDRVAEQQRRDSGRWALPPSFDLGHPGLLGDLRDLGVVWHLHDGRVQVPDVYRVHFKLKRRGGVPQPRV